MNFSRYREKGFEMIINSNEKIQYIVQMDHPDTPLNMSSVLEILQDTGIDIDQSYGPILIDRKRGRYVVRGRATAEEKTKAEKIPGLRFFADVKQEKI